MTVVPDTSQEPTSLSSQPSSTQDSPDFESMNSQQITDYANSIMQQAVEDAQAGGDPQRLYEQIEDVIDTVMEVPV